jgi:homoserine O-succinyltransferase/O-acetyltransferase
MPLTIEGGRVPTNWAEKKCLGLDASSPKSTRWTESLRIALINNMPDSAMEDTETQFFALLEAAAGQAPVCVKLFSLPGVPRGTRGTQRLGEYYYGIEELWNGRFDGVIVTGTEPRQADLRREPYWSAMADVFDWAERHTSSTILSCLAAHAGVLHTDGITRNPLSHKMCGVFACWQASDHALMKDSGNLVQFPHSRWNEVREDDLAACGYTVVTKSMEAGVDCFVKKKRKSLFVHFQGHPEYEALTLFKEYRRDLRRFLSGERPNYPGLPHGYFDATATKFLAGFQERALSHRREDLMTEFPEAALTAGLQRSWAASANGVYRNWLQYLASRRAARLRFARTSIGRSTSGRKPSQLCGVSTSQ